MNLLFVYGTLKKGHKRHHLLGGASLVGRGYIEGFSMYSINGMFPAIVPAPTGNGKVYGEIYEVTEDILEECDFIEGVHNNLYRRELVPVYIKKAEMVEAYVYIFNEGISSFERIENGKWKRRKYGD